MRRHEEYSYAARREADAVLGLMKNPPADWYTDPDDPDDFPAIFGINLAEKALALDLLDFFEADTDLDVLVERVIRSIADHELLAVPGAMESAVGYCQLHLWRRAAEAQEAGNVR
ncbi:hypothetical protein [Bosea sp. UC22_33]|uniref:hypothetical protein n=1 Tax=Bosea sp. UC22_33 TaxID=3350165 RepID=UPI003672CC60